MTLHLPIHYYTSPYTTLLQRTEIKPIYQVVLYRRIQLAQGYSRGTRYLPPGTIRGYFQNNALRRRFHHFAIVPEESTGLRFRDSALEVTVQLWNRVPHDLVDQNATNIRGRLERSSYSDAIWDAFADMSAATLAL
jgi:hypothetical protein